MSKNIFNNYSQKLGRHGIFATEPSTQQTPTQLRADEFQDFLAFLLSTELTSNFRFRRLENLFKHDVGFSKQWLTHHTFIIEWAAEYLHLSPTQNNLDITIILGEFFYQQALNGHQPDFEHCKYLLTQAITFHHFPALKHLIDLHIGLQRYDLALALIAQQQSQFGVQGLQLQQLTFERVADLNSHPQAKKHYQQQALIALYKLYFQHAAHNEVLELKENELLAQGMFNSHELDELRTQAEYHHKLFDFKP